MDPEQLIKAIHADPFVPFTLHVRYGEDHEIDRPEMAIMANNRLSVVIAMGSGAFSVIATRSITEIEFLAPAV